MAIEVYCIVLYTRTGINAKDTTPTKLNSWYDSQGALLNQYVCAALSYVNIPETEKPICS